MDKLKRSALFPFLFALFPLLALWASNVEYIAPWMTLRVILITLAATCIGFFSLRYTYKSSIKAGIFVCVLLLIFFSYGHLYRMFGERVLFGFLPIRHRTLVALSILLIGLTIWLLKRMRSNHRWDHPSVEPDRWFGPGISIDHDHRLSGRNCKPGSQK